MLKVAQAVLSGGVCVMLCVVPVDGAERLNAAILDLDALNVSPAIATGVAEILRDALFKTGRFNVMERKAMEAVLKEQQFQKSGCTTTECAVEVGKLLNVNSMIKGSVNRLGPRHTVTIILVDVETGSVKESESGECESEGQLPDTARVVAQKLSSRLPAEGKVVRVESHDEVYISVGSSDGAVAGSKLQVFRKKAVTDDQGKILMHKTSEVGQLELMQVDKEASIAKFFDEKQQLSVGDWVRIGAVKVIGASKMASQPPPSFSQLPNLQDWGTPAGALVRSALFPGLGQFYNHSELKGTVFAGLGGVFVLGVLSASGEANEAEKLHREFDPNNPGTETRSLSQLKEDATTKRKAVADRFGGLTFLWVIGMVDAYVFSPFHGVQAVSMTPTDGGAKVSYRVGF